jgi:hypothetical protein
VLPSSGPGSPRKLELPDPEDDGLKILPNIISIYHSEERNIPLRFETSPVVNHNN